MSLKESCIFKCHWTSVYAVATCLWLPGRGECWSLIEIHAARQIERPATKTRNKSRVVIGPAADRGVKRNGKVCLSEFKDSGHRDKGWEANLNHDRRGESHACVLPGLKKSSVFPVILQPHTGSRYWYVYCYYSTFITMELHSNQLVVKTLQFQLM